MIGRVRPAGVSFSVVLHKKRQQHKRHPLTASRASVEHIHCRGAGSMLKRCVSMQLFCRMGQTRGNRVVGEWSDKGAGRLGGVWGPLGRSTNQHFLNLLIFFAKVKKQCLLGILRPNRVDRVCVVVGSWRLEVGS